MVTHVCRLNRAFDLKPEPLSCTFWHLFVHAGNYTPIQINEPLMGSASDFLQQHVRNHVLRDCEKPLGGKEGDKTIVYNFSECLSKDVPAWHYIKHA